MIALRRLAVVSTSGLLLLIGACTERGRSDEIEYRGEKIRLSKAYSDYDDYKNDPDNIASFETARVQKLVSEAPIEGRVFADRLAMAKAVSAICFPGYGSGAIGGVDGAIVVYSVEIPRAEKDRYLTFRRGDGGYRLVDDFITPTALAIERAVEENGELVYLARDGQRARTRPIP